MGEKLLDNVAEDIGENYVYLKTIVENRFELLKLDFLESVSKMTGYLIVTALIVFFSSISLIGVILMTSWFIGQSYQHPQLGLLLGFLSLIPIGILIFLGRRYFIFNPIAKFLLENFANSKSKK